MLPIAGLSAMCRLRYFVSLLSLLGVFVVLNAVGKTPHMPTWAIGCDPYGYFRQAELFRDSGLVGGLDTRLETPEARYLIDTAQALRLEPERWYQLVAPHCHHYRVSTDAVILQYPPGTGLLLSLLPEGQEIQLLYIASVLAFPLVLGLMAAWRGLSPPTLLAGVLTLFVAFQVQTAPVAMSSFSLPATLALIPVLCLLALAATHAGDRRGITFAALVGLVAGLLFLIRLPNALFVVGIAALFVVQWRLWRWSTIRPAIRTVVVGIAGFGLAGLIPFMLTSRINTGSWLSTTYSPMDASPPTFDMATFERAVDFYLHRSFSWPIVLLSILILFAGCAVAAAGREGERRVLPGSVLAAIVVGHGLSLAYFFAHRVMDHHYLVPASYFALCLFTIGLAWRDCGAAAFSYRFRSFGAGLVILVVGCVAALRIDAVEPVQHRPVAPAGLLDPSAIVWTDVSGGTLQFYHGKYGVKLPFADECTRDRMIARIHADGRPQYFIRDSETMAGLITRYAEIGVLSEDGHYHVGAAYPVFRLDSLAPERLACR